MATVLAGFVGRPRHLQGAVGSYQSANYAFSAENDCPAHQRQAQFFGTALLDHLQCLGRSVSRWLVMGTAQSGWGSLLESLPVEQHAAADDVTLRVFAAYEEQNASQPLLDEWGAALTSSRTDGIEVVCRLTGDAASPESQEAVYRALSNVVKNRDSLVFDISHGLRHQPVVAAFVVMQLRWLRDLQQVDIYNGALELSREGIAPVVKLDVCTRLIESTEAVATWRHTGNYRPLGLCLTDDVSIREQIENVSFIDETNQPAQGAARQLLKDIRKLAIPAGSVRASLRGQLEHSLKAVSQTSTARYFADKAEFCFSRGQYARAISLLWEAFLIAAVEKHNLGDVKKYQVRQEGERQLRTDLNQTAGEIKNCVKELRGAVVHGTEEDSARTKDALQSAQDFKQVFRDGHNLLLDYLTKAGL